MKKRREEEYQEDNFAKKKNFVLSSIHFFLSRRFPQVRWAFSPSSPAGSSGRATARRLLLPRGRISRYWTLDYPTHSMSTLRPPSTRLRSKRVSLASRLPGMSTRKVKLNSPLFSLPFRQQQQQQREQQRVRLRALSSSSGGGSPSPSCRTR